MKFEGLVVYAMLRNHSRPLKQIVPSRKNTMEWAVVENFHTQVYSDVLWLMFGQSLNCVCVRFSDLIHGDHVSRYELGAVDQAVRPAHLHHVALCWRPESHAVSVL